MLLVDNITCAYPHTRTPRARVCIVITSPYHLSPHPTWPPACYSTSSSCTCYVCILYGWYVHCRTEHSAITFIYNASAFNVQFPSLNVLITLAQVPSSPSVSQVPTITATATAVSGVCQRCLRVYARFRGDSVHLEGRGRVDECNRGWRESPTGVCPVSPDTKTTRTVHALRVNSYTDNDRNEYKFPSRFFTTKDRRLQRAS